MCMDYEHIKYLVHSKLSEILVCIGENHGDIYVQK